MWSALTLASAAALHAQSAPRHTHRHEPNARRGSDDASAAHAGRPQRFAGAVVERCTRGDQGARRHLRRSRCRQSTAVRALGRSTRFRRPRPDCLRRCRFDGDAAAGIADGRGAGAERLSSALLPWPGAAAGQAASLPLHRLRAGHDVARTDAAADDARRTARGDEGSRHRRRARSCRSTKGNSAPWMNTPRIITRRDLLRGVGVVERGGRRGARQSDHLARAARSRARRRASRPGRAHDGGCRRTVREPDRGRSGPARSDRRSTDSVGRDGPRRERGAASCVTSIVRSAARWRSSRGVLRGESAGARSLCAVVARQRFPRTARSRQGLGAHRLRDRWRTRVFREARRSSSAWCSATRGKGMFGDPYYGGNVNFVGWDLIGYPGVRTNVSAADQKALEAEPVASRITARPTTTRASTRPPYSSIIARRPGCDAGGARSWPLS